MQRLKLITPSSPAFPVTVEEFKLYGRIDQAYENDTIERLLKAATKRTEKYCNRQWLQTTYELARDAFPSPCDEDSDHFASIELWPTPLTAIDSITFIDTSGAEQTLEPDKYQVDTYSEPGRVTPAYDESWPDTRCQPNAVKILFTCGHASAEDVPEDVKTAVQMLALYWFQNRDMGHHMPAAVKELLEDYRLERYL